MHAQFAETMAFAIACNKILQRFRFSTWKALDEIHKFLQEDGVHYHVLATPVSSSFTFASSLASPPDCSAARTFDECLFTCTHVLLRDSMVCFKRVGLWGNCLIRQQPQLKRPPPLYSRNILFKSMLNLPLVWLTVRIRRHLQKLRPLGAFDTHVNRCKLCRCLQVWANLFIT